jgi:hypothetical protein
VLLVLLVGELPALRKQLPERRRANASKPDLPRLRVRENYRGFTGGHNYELHCAPNRATRLLLSTPF